MNTFVTTRNPRALTLSVFFWICFVGGILLPTENLQAESAISARYIQAQGTQLVIEVMAGPNPPASAILIQRFPQGVKMLSSHPDASNYDSRSNTAKWLLRNLRQGKTTISITLNRPVKGSEMSADLRFKPQGGRSMATIQVSK